MFRKISLAILVIFSFYFSPIPSYCEDWSYIGYSKMTDNSNFYIFTLAKNSPNSDLLSITEKHVFSTKQKMPNGTSFNSVVISRTLNCADRSISTDKAVFSNSLGTAVGKFESKNIGKIFNKIEKSNEIDIFLMGKYCDRDS